MPFTGLKNMVGAYVYVFKTDDGLCKVGFSKNPLRRLNELDRASTSSIEIFAAYHCRAYARIEKRAHQILAPVLANREWFRCSPEVAAAAVERAADSYGEIVVPQTLQIGNRNGCDVFFFWPADKAIPADAMGPPNFRSPLSASSVSP